MKNLSILVLAVFTCMLCSASTPIKTKNNEAIVIGRLILDTKAMIKSDKLEINLSLSPKGKTKIKVDKNGFFAAKITEGYHITDHIKYGDGGNFQKRLYYECLTVTVPNAGKVYYVGDIYVKWTPTDRDKVTKGFSIGVGIGGRYGGGSIAVPVSEGNTPGEDCPEITIKETQQAIDWFHQTYPTDNREVVTQFMDLF